MDGENLLWWIRKVTQSAAARVASGPHLARGRRESSTRFRLFKIGVKSAAFAARAPQTGLLDTPPARGNNRPQESAENSKQHATSSLTTRAGGVRRAGPAVG
jgi:hypothetical protein